MSKNDENLQKLALHGQISAAICHDLQSPVSYLDSNNRYLLKKISKHIEGEPAKEVIEILNENTEGLSQIKELLDSIKSFMRDDFTSTNILINDLIESCIKMTLPQAKSKVKISKYLPEESVITNGNQSRLKQVITNLLINAIESFDQDHNEPEIRVTYTTKKQKLIISVEDNGCGISKEKIDSIFDWYVTSKKHGTGQGLAISKKIIKEHNGEISCESTLGKGTKFEIILPLGVEQ